MYTNLSHKHKYKFKKYYRYRNVIIPWWWHIAVTCFDYLFIVTHQLKNFKYSDINKIDKNVNSQRYSKICAMCSIFCFLFLLFVCIHSYTL